MPLPFRQARTWSRSARMSPIYLMLTDRRARSAVMRLRPWTTGSAGDGGWMSPGHMQSVLAVALHAQRDEGCSRGSVILSDNGCIRSLHKGKDDETHHGYGSNRVGGGGAPLRPPTALHVRLRIRQFMQHNEVLPSDSTSRRTCTSKWVRPTRAQAKNPRH